jgi:hypothetical protein
MNAAVAALLCFPTVPTAFFLSLNGKKKETKKIKKVEGRQASLGNALIFYFFCISLSLPF